MQTHLIVHELDVTPVNLLALILCLLLLEHMLVKVLLQFLVGQVDTKLQSEGMPEARATRNARCSVMSKRLTPTQKQKLLAG
jgi:hypothetical protein